MMNSRSEHRCVVVKEIQGIRFGIDSGHRVEVDGVPFFLPTVSFCSKTGEKRVEELPPLPCNSVLCDLRSALIRHLTDFLEDPIDDQVEEIHGLILRSALRREDRPTWQRRLSAACFIVAGFIIGVGCSISTPRVDPAGDETQSKVAPHSALEKVKKEDWDIQKCVSWAMSKKLGSNERFLSVFRRLGERHLNAGICKATIYAFSRMQIEGKDSPRVRRAKQYLSKFSYDEASKFVAANAENHGYRASALMAKYEEVMSP